MHANVGDRLVLRARGGGPGRDGEILTVHGLDGAPPYTVRWSDNGHETYSFPGSGAYVQHFDHPDTDEAAASQQAAKADV